MASYVGGGGGRPGGRDMRHSRWCLLASQCTHVLVGTSLTDCVRVCPSIMRVGTWHCGFIALYSSDSYTHEVIQKQKYKMSLIYALAKLVHSAPAARRPAPSLPPCTRIRSLSTLELQYMQHAIHRRISACIQVRSMTKWRQNLPILTLHEQELLK